MVSLENNFDCDNDQFPIYVDASLLPNAQESPPNTNEPTANASRRTSVNDNDSNDNPSKEIPSTEKRKP
jgi:hypothetical protein